MTCEKCHESEMVPTQVSRAALGLGIRGQAVALGAVLVLGAVVGLGLAVARAGNIDLSWALIAAPLFLLACTPVVAFGAARVFSEEKIWRCKHCDYMLDRA